MLIIWLWQTEFSAAPFDSLVHHYAYGMIGLRQPALRRIWSVCPDCLAYLFVCCRKNCNLLIGDKLGAVVAPAFVSSLTSY